MQANHIAGDWEVRKEAIVEIRLIEKANEKSNQELKKDIFGDLSKYPAKIVWMEKVTKVEVREA